MTAIKHFCHVCNIKFQRAIDFILHKHEEIKPIIEKFVGEEKNDRM